MPVMDSSELVLATLASFDPKCKDFEFHRTFPLAIYVDVGDQSPEIGRGLAEFIARVLSEQDFEIQELVSIDGSYCQLNLCRSRVPLDEPSFRKRIQFAGGVLSHWFNNPLVKESARIAGSTAVAVVAIGTAVQIAQATHLDLPTIGSFTVPPSIWASLVVAKETRDLVKEVVSIFVNSKAAKKALKQAKQQTLSEKESVPASARTLSTKTIGYEVPTKDEKIRRLEKTLSQVQQEIQELKSEQNEPPDRF